MVEVIAQVPMQAGMRVDLPGQVRNGLDDPAQARLGSRLSNLDPFAPRCGLPLKATSKALEQRQVVIGVLSATRQGGRFDGW